METSFDFQPTLSNELVSLRPLQPSDFEALYQIAGDPMLWQQHPCWDRYQLPVFQALFEDGIQSGGALALIDNRTGQLIGSSRYYDLATNSVTIGYTYVSRTHWGLGYNAAMKVLMLRHAFRFVPKVLFYVAAQNFRSRKAVEKLGAHLVGTEVHGIGIEHLMYLLDKDAWFEKNNNF